MKDQFDEHWTDVTATFVKEGLESRLGAKVQEITKSHPEVFTVDNACKVGTQSETEMESEQY